MKYLFFDCEFATSKGGIEKICEFGFVVVDENFNVIMKDNIIINPNIQRNEWDYRVVRKILTRKIYQYEDRLTFPAYYKKIAALINSSDYVLGHSLSGDAHALNCECQRYGLPSLNYEFYDIKEFYKTYNASKEDTSLKNIMASLEIEGDSNSHDAGADAYNTMLELKVMMKKLEMKLPELIKLCPKAKDKTENYLVESRVIAEKQREERRKQMLEGDYSDGSNYMISMRRHSNKKIFVQFLDNVEVTNLGSGRFKDKKISISINYECKHFKEIMNIVQIIKNEGGKYVLKCSEADIFVTYESFHEDGTPRECSRLKYVNEANANGASIKIINFNQFLEMLGMSNEELESLPLPPIDCLFKEGAIIKDKKAIFTK